MRSAVLIIFICTLSLGLRALAEEVIAPVSSSSKTGSGGKNSNAAPISEDEFSSEGDSSEGEPVPVVKTSKAKESKGKRYREKEAEGTEAPDRFEADSIIKSRYRHNGEQLEVDPD